MDRTPLYQITVRLKPNSGFADRSFTLRTRHGLLDARKVGAEVLGILGLNEDFTSGKTNCGVDAFVSAELVEEDK